MNNPDDATGGSRPSGTDRSADEVVDGELVDDAPADTDDAPADTDGTPADTDEVADTDDTDDTDQAPTDDDHADPEHKEARESGTVESGAAAGSPASGASSGLTGPAPAPAFDYTDQGVPTLNYVRDKIENRLGTALGSADLAGTGDTAEQQSQAAQDRERLAKEKLAELRRQVDGGTSQS